MGIREKGLLGLAGLATGVVAGVLGCEIVAAVMFAMSLFQGGVLLEVPMFGSMLGLVMGPIFAFKEVSLGRAALYTSGLLCLCFIGINTYLYATGIIFRTGVYAANIGFAIAAGAVSGATIILLKREAWPWLASLFAPPAPLPFTVENNDKERYSV